MKPVLPYDIDFQIVETLRWSSPADDGWLKGKGTGFFLLERHVERMADAAMHAGFRFDSSCLRAMLLKESEELRGALFKVRALLYRSGHLDIESVPLAAITVPVRLCMSEHAVDSSDPFLYYKTTRRDLYSNEHSRAVANGYFDVIFTNERGEVTEGAISNIFLEQNDGTFLTPPVSSGLLSGTLRQSLIDAGVVQESVIYPNELQGAVKIYCGNSVRGMLEACAVDGISCEQVRVIPVKPVPYQQA